MVKLIFRQVASGHNYFLTVIVGATNCSASQPYQPTDCQITNPDANLRCDLVVLRTLAGRSTAFRLTKQVCDKGRDWKPLVC